MASNEARGSMGGMAEALHDKSLLVDQGKAFHILGDMEGGLVVLPGLEHGSGRDGQGTVPGAAWGASDVENGADGVHDSHVVRLLESTAGDMELTVVMVLSCHDGMMHVLVDGRLNSQIFAATGGVQNVTPFVFAN